MIPRRVPGAPCRSLLIKVMMSSLSRLWAARLLLADAKPELRPVRNRLDSIRAADILEDPVGVLELQRREHGAVPLWYRLRNFRTAL